LEGVFISRTASDVVGVLKRLRPKCLTILFPGVRGNYARQNP
jgi:hypothetical protein